METSRRLSPKLVIMSVAGLLALAVILLTVSAVSATDRIEIFDLFRRRLVTWSPPSVTTTVAAGESQTIPVSFTTPQPLSNVVARVSPELEPYVQVEPREFAVVDAGATIPLNLIVSAPADVLAGTIDGNIRLFREFRFHFGAKGVITFRLPILFAKPLPIIMTFTEPTIAWTPSSITETFLPGESQTYPASFIASENVNNVVLRVVPELQPFVQVSPSSLASITKGQTVNLNVVVSAPVDSLPKVVDGVIQVWSGVGAPTTFAEPLPVTVSVVEASPQPPFGHLELNPLNITAQIPTHIFAEIVISDTKLIPQSIRLNRLDENNKIIATLDNLRDDGLGGDRIAGDRRYGAEVSLTRPTEGKVYLRASAALEGVSDRLLSTIVSILVLPPVGSTEPEDFIRSAAAAFQSAQTVNDVQAFIIPELTAALQEFVDAGAPLSELAEALATARPSWKTDEEAEFQTTTTISSGEVARSSITIRKFPEGWKIVTF